MKMRICGGRAFKMLTLKPYVACSIHRWKGMSQIEGRIMESLTFEGSEYKAKRLSTFTGRRTIAVAVQHWFFWVSTS